MIGPVGHYVSWTSGTSKEQENSKSKKEEGNTEEKTAGGEDESGKHIGEQHGD